MTAPTTSNISNDLVAFWEQCVKTDVPYSTFESFIAAYIQQEKSALLNELLEQKKVYITELAWKHAAHEYAVEVSVIEAKLKDLNQGGEDE